MDQIIKSILIPTDFSEPSKSAFKLGVAIAKRQGAEITLLHVVDRLTLLPPAELFMPNVQLIPELTRKLENKLAKLANEIITESGVKTNSKVIIGTPSDKICRFAKNEKFSLIVMGTHGVSGIREFLIGSETYRVVSNAATPVLSVPANWHKTDFQKVLFPIRLIPESIDKYFFSRPIIEKNNSELTLLGLSEKKSPDKLPEITLIMDKFKIILHNDNVVFKSVLSPCENFPEKVIEMSNELESDLIILTTNQKYDLKTYFLGPYLQQIVNHSKRPVLSVKPGNK